MSKAYMIGIAGASASGKSTFVELLEERLSGCKVKVIHMDEYYKAEDERPVIQGYPDEKTYIDDNHPQALDFDRIYAFPFGNGNDFDMDKTAINSKN